jgi:hypothetical protein
MRIIGFTGTSTEPNAVQARTLKALLKALDPEVLHHGDAIGADALADALCHELAIGRVAHPGENTAGDSPKRAFCAADVILEPARYMERNDHIIADTEAMICVPAGPPTLRNGEWATTRHALAAGRDVFVIWPVGSITVLEPGDTV